LWLEIKNRPKIKKQILSKSGIDPVYKDKLPALDLARYPSTRCIWNLSEFTEMKKYTIPY
jgi:hypothetical protein